VQIDGRQAVPSWDRGTDALFILCGRASSAPGAIEKPHPWLSRLTQRRKVMLIKPVMASSGCENSAYESEL
jgi:hypothetical protein